MSEKRFNTRIVNKHDTEVNWSKSSLIPLQGEVIIFDIDDNYSYERIKIGNGAQNVNELPFYAGSWEDLSNRPFGSEGITTIEWDGDITGLPVSSDGTVYKVSDLKPTSTEIIGGKLSFSRGNVETITADVITEYGYITSVYYNTILINTSNGSAYNHELNVTLPEPGIYIQKNTYNQLLSLSYGHEEIHQLDEKYIPDTIARVADVSDQISTTIGEIPVPLQADWNESDDTSLAYIKNKTHGVEKVDVVVIEEQEVTFTLSESLYMAEVLGTFLHEPEMVDENGFTIIWDGEVYQKSLIVFDEGYFVGNIFIFTGDESHNTGEPFLFMCNPNACIVACQQSEGMVHTISLSYSVENVQKLDIKYLPSDVAFKYDIPAMPTIPTNISAFVNDAEYVALIKGDEQTFEFVRDETYSGDHFEWNAFDYYKVSDMAPLYDDVTAVKGTWMANGNVSTQTNIIAGTSCYYAGHAIVVVEPGSCTLSNIVFNAPSAGIYFKKSSDTYYQTALSMTFARKCISDNIIPDNIARIPKVTNVTLYATSWAGDANPYSQVVTINGVTVNSKVDLQPTALQIVDLQNNDIALMAENDNGVVTVYAIGGKPTVDYTMQALITEVAIV